MTKLFLSVLGELRVALDGAPVSDFESIKARALLVYLAVQARSGHSRNSLAGLLWPDVPDDSARNNLRQTLASLRQTLRDRQAPDQPLLHITRDTVQLNPDAYCWTDVAQFGAHLTRPVNTGGLSPESYLAQNSDLANTRCTTNTNPDGITARVCFDTIAFSYSADIIAKPAGSSSELLTLSTSARKGEDANVFYAMLASIKPVP